MATRSEEKLYIGLELGQLAYRKQITHTNSLNTLMEFYDLQTWSERRLRA